MWPLVLGMLVIIGLICLAGVAAALCAGLYWLFQSMMGEAEKMRAKRPSVREVRDK